RERGDLSVREAVTRATGITSNGAPGNGGTALAARGFAGQGSVMQLYDGTRLYVASGTVTFPFDTWSVDRIEVLRGAASVMYGEGAIGGVVNVIPKKPMRAPIANELQLTGGTQKTARAAFDSGSAVNENVPYRDRWTRLAAQWQPNERVTVRNQFYYLTSQRHWRDAESYTFLPASGQVRRTDYLEILHDQEQVGDRADLKIDGQLFGMANTA